MSARASHRLTALGRPSRRLLDGAAALTAYLPLALMALLALATWWLVRNTPLPEAPRPAGPPRGEPDYVMQGFTVQRFDATGGLRAQIQGQRLQHFPDTDTLEVDGPRVLSRDAAGRTIEAQAVRATSNADASELALIGQVRLRRVGLADEPVVEFEGEELRASQRRDRIEAPQPVIVRRAGSVLRADRAVYDNAQRVLTLQGRVRATFEPPPRAGGRPAR